MDISAEHFPSNASDYELNGQIGLGATAQVWSGRCNAVGEDVAIKVIDLENVTTNLEEIRNEIRVMSLCNHENVVKYYCSFVHDGHYLWLVMPLMHGGSFQNIMRSYGPLEEDVIVVVLHEVLKGIDYFHRNDHIHRDIKASNIVVDREGSVRIADFGISATLNTEGMHDRSECRQTFVGTPCWMAPEVMEQVHGYDWRADIWSFGMTAIELAHGKAPYDGMAPMKVLLLILKHPPPPLENGGKQLKFSQAFHDLVKLCLQKEPADRSSAQDLLGHAFFADVERHKKCGRLKQILDTLPPLVQRFSTTEQHIPRSGVWTVDKGQMAEAMSGEHVPKSISWDFSDPPEMHVPDSHNQPESDSDEETPVTIDVSGIDAGLLLSDTAGIVCSGEGHNIMQNGCEDPKSVLYNATAGDTPLSWLDVDVSNLTREKMVEIATMLQQLQAVEHRSIIRVHKSGFSAQSGRVVLITESIPPNTVERYAAPEGVPVHTAQLWGTQVVNALCALHACEPPIVHGALRCDHLIVDITREGAVCKIGGFAHPPLSAEERTKVAVAAYIPPELYDEDELTPKVDVYALGMCMLHILTGKEPYEDCNNSVQVYKRVEEGVLPLAIDLITDPDARSFVEACLRTAEQRPAASDLLTHEFLTKPLEPKVALSGGQLKGVKGSKVSLCLTLQIKGKQKEISFGFDRDQDTAHGLSEEMVGSVTVLKEAGLLLVDTIEHTIVQLVKEAEV